MRLRAAVVVVPVLALLTACGEPAVRPFNPGGTAERRADTLVPSSAPTSGETVEVATGLSVVFEDALPADPQQAGAIQAFRRNFVDSWKAIVSQGRDETYLKSVYGEASRAAYESVQSYVSRGRSITGVGRIYHLRITSTTGRSMQLDACVDETKVRIVDARTGQPAATQPKWARRPYFQVAVVRLGDDETYRVGAFRHAVYPDERAKEC
ncbi:hypothetical protein [Rhizohabitans arisaemae]|uniref:hypothetical protein n=1 Tax=Rhizohabitans arisaemae TaxID=2720610 RepID=UPI0024B23473|nr:hypothetical protein [Rhizohabitans arisaemae]